MERISTGIAGFDSLLQGGIPRGFVFGVLGGPGSGKTILGLQYMWAGVNAREDVLYAILEGEADHVEDQAIQFGWNLPENKHFHTFRQEAKDVSDMCVKIQDYITKYGVSRLVVDSISMYNLFTKSRLGYDLQFARVGLETESEKTNRQVVEQIRDMELTSMLLIEDFEGTREEDKVLESACDGVVQLGVNPALNTRSLRVVKMRETDHPLSAKPFTIEDEGIVFKNQK